jgi:hypothetical protein
MTKLGEKGPDVHLGIILDLNKSLGKKVARLLVILVYRSRKSLHHTACRTQVWRAAATAMELRHLGGATLSVILLHRPILHVRP